jgi:amino acid transporter
VTASATGAGLRRELNLRDITLFGLACIVGARWIAPAAHAGPGSLTLWVLGAVLFMVPLSIAVAELTVRHPDAGGMYIWTRADYGEWHGFLCFWVYWVGSALWFPPTAMFYTSAAAYMLGPRFAPLATDRAFLLTASLAAIWIALATNIIGVHIGKWTENLGAIASWTLGVILAVAAWRVWSRHGSATHFSLLPNLSWNTINFWASIAYALTGMELVGLMGGEVRDPRRNIPRAARLITPVAVLFYAGSTASALVILPAAKISEVNGISEMGQAAGSLLGVPWLPALLAALLLFGAVGQFGGFGSSVSRMPLAAGVDRLLPAAFARVHPRWGTPHISIIGFGIVASALLIVVQLGDTLRAAYDTLISLMVIAGFLPFLYIFGSAWKAGRRISVVSGVFVTVLAIVCAIVPTPDITRVWLYEGKLFGGTGVVILSAWLIYRRAPRTSVH